MSVVFNAGDVEKLIGLETYRDSLVEARGAYFCMTREPQSGVRPDRRLAIVTPPHNAPPEAFEGEATQCGEHSLMLCALTPANARALRAILPWLNPTTLGLRTSAGLGDRLGLATPGHVRAVRAIANVAPIFPQQSIREMTRTGRTPQQVMDDATWGVFQEGWRDGFGADADHLKTPDDIDSCVAAGFTFFTFDPGEHVDNSADTAGPDELRAQYAKLPWDKLRDNPHGAIDRYARHTFDVEGHRISFDNLSVLRAAVKYGAAVAHVGVMYQSLLRACGDRPFEVEVSVDETATPTTHAEHVYIARELLRLGVNWVSLAPRYIGSFEKGVDYIGALDVFERDFAVHAAIARQFGPYKLSLHSGSDKFSIYPIAMRQTEGLVHLKTAGTSYLEALRTIAAVDPAFFRLIYVFARERYETDRASYHVSARLDGAPLPESLSDVELPSLLEQFDAREILHVTFGSVLTARAGDGQYRFYRHFITLLQEHSEAYAQNLREHFIRHLAPFAALSKAQA